MHAAGRAPVTAEKSLLCSFLGETTHLLEFSSVLVLWFDLLEAGASAAPGSV